MKKCRYKLNVMVVRNQLFSFSSFLQKQESRVSGENRDPVFEMVPDWSFTPYLIRGQDDVWTPAFAGVTDFGFSCRM